MTGDPIADAVALAPVQQGRWLVTYPPELDSLCPELEQVLYFGSPSQHFYGYVLQAAIDPHGFHLASRIILMNNQLMTFDGFALVLRWLIVVNVGSY